MGSVSEGCFRVPSSSSTKGRKGRTMAKTRIPVRGVRTFRISESIVQGLSQRSSTLNIPTQSKVFFFDFGLVPFCLISSSSSSSKKNASARFFASASSIISSSSSSSLALPLPLPPAAPPPPPETGSLACALSSSTSSPSPLATASQASTQSA